MSPQPKKPADEKDPTTEDVARNRETPDPPENKPTFTVEDLRVRGAEVLGRGFELPDIVAALSALPKTREISVTDAKQRVRDWLAAEPVVDPPIEG